MASPFQAEQCLQTDSGDGGESDFEHLTPTYVAEPQAMHNWLGKLYLAYRLGKITSEAATPSVTQDELHVSRPSTDRDTRPNPLISPLTYRWN